MTKVLAEKNYETLMIVPIEAAEKTVDELMESIKALLQKENAPVSQMQVWGRRRLAYAIRRHKEGVYIYFDFTGGPNAPGALAKFLRVKDTVIRFMTVEKEEFPAEAGAAATPPAAEAAAAAVATAPAASPETTSTPSGDQEG